MDAQTRDRITKQLTKDITENSKDWSDETIKAEVSQAVALIELSTELVEELERSIDNAIKKAKNLKIDYETSIVGIMSAVRSFSNKHHTEAIASLAASSLSNRKFSKNANH